MYIRLEDLKKWRAERIQNGDCSFDDMMALAVFIEECEKFECHPRQGVREAMSEPLTDDLQPKWKN